VDNFECEWYNWFPNPMFVTYYASLLYSLSSLLWMPVIIASRKTIFTQIFVSGNASGEYIKDKHRSQMFLFEHDILGDRCKIISL
jgi:hypothetical protein